MDRTNHILLQENLSDFPVKKAGAGLDTKRYVKDTWSNPARDDR